MTITLKREEADPTNAVGDRGSWPLKISAFFDEAMTDPAPIFVYQRAGQGSSLNGDSFCYVADVMNMNEIPLDMPTDDVPFFRVAVVDVVCRSQTHLLEFWDIVVSSVRTLVDETAAAATATVEILTIAP